MAVIDQATVQLQAQTDQFDRSVEASRQKLITFDRTLEDIGRDLTTLRSGLSSAQTGFSTLDRSASEAARALGQFNTTAGAQAASGLSRTTSSIRNLGFGFQNAGFQVSDFFVQLETGTPVARAFGQQFPQLISGFGLLGGKIGLVATGIGTFVAVGAALYSILRDGRTILERTTDLTEELAEAVQKSADAYSNLGDTASGVIDKFVELDQAERTLLELNLEVSLQKNIQALKKFGVEAEQIVTEFRDEVLFQQLRDPDRLLLDTDLVKNLTEDLSDTQAKALFDLIQTFRQNIEEQGGITKDALDSLIGDFDKLRSSVQGELPETFTDFLEIIGQLVDVTGATAEETARLQKIFDTLKAPVGNIEQYAAGLREAAKEADRVAANELLEWFEEFKEKISDVTDEERELRDGNQKLTELYLRGVIPTFQQLIELQDQLADSIFNTTEKVSEQAVAAGELYKELQRLATSSLADTFDEEADAVEALENRLDPLTKIQSQYTEGRRILTQAVLAGVISQEREAELIALLDAERAKAIAGLDKESDARDKLAAKVNEAIDDLERELEFLIELGKAQRKSVSAVNELKDAYEAENLIRRLKIDDLGLEAGETEELKNRIRELVGAINDADRANKRYNEQQQENIRRLRELEQERKKQLEALKREVEQTLDAIDKEAKDIFGGIVEGFANGFEGSLDSLKDKFVDFLITLAYEAAIRPIVLNVAANALGGVAGQAAQGMIGGGGMFGGSPLSNLSSLSNLITGGPSSLATSFVTSSLGQSLGLSAATGTVFGAEAGIAGGIAASGVAPTTAGSALIGAAGPIAGLIGAGLLAYQMGIIGPGPSSGPVGIADFSPGLGRALAFGPNAQNPMEFLTADNDGDPEGMRPIAEAIAELIYDSADHLGATIDQSLRFRVANYASPEPGNSADRVAGFEVNAFIRGEAERRIAEGLTQDQAIFEAFKFAVTEAFTFTSADLTEAVKNTTAETTEDLLADLDFAQNFSDLRDALDSLGGEINQSTLAQAQLTIAIQNQAKEFAQQAVEPIAEGIATALELFPAVGGTITETRTRTVQEERDITGYDEGAIRTLGTELVDVVQEYEEVIGKTALEQERYTANLERLGDVIAISKAEVDTLINTVTGDFEPTIRGPFQEALEQGQANLEALRDELISVNEEITAVNEAFDGLDATLIDVTGTIDAAQTALIENLQDEFTQSIQQQLNELTGQGFINQLLAAEEQRTQDALDAAALGLNVNDTAGLIFDKTVRAILGQVSITDIQDIINSGDITDTGTLAILEQYLSEQLATVQDAFTAQLLGSQNQGVLNTIFDLQTARDTNATVAAMAGLDINATAGTVFDQAVRAALESSSLSDLGALITSGLITDEGTQAILDAVLAEKALEEIRRQETLAMEEQLSTLRELESEIENFAELAADNARALRNAAAELRISPGITPLSPIDRQAEILAQIRAAQALAGDEDPFDDESQEAIGRLPSLVRAYLDASLEINGANKDFYSDFQFGQEVLTDIASAQEDIAQQQLDKLEEIRAQIEELGGQLEQSELSPSELAAQQGFNFGANSTANRQIFDALSYAGLATPTGFGSGQLSQLRAQNPAVNALVSALGFSSGGLVTGGRAGQDSMLMFAQPGEFVVNTRGVQAAGLQALQAINSGNAFPANDQGVVEALYYVAGRIDSLAAQQAAEHAEDVSVVEGLGRRMTRPVSYGGRA